MQRNQVPRQSKPSREIAANCMLNAPADQIITAASGSHLGAAELRKSHSAIATAIGVIVINTSQVPTLAPCWNPCMLTSRARNDDPARGAASQIVDELSKLVFSRCLLAACANPVLTPNCSRSRVLGRGNSETVALLITIETATVMQYSKTTITVLWLPAAAAFGNMCSLLLVRHLHPLNEFNYST